MDTLAKFTTAYLTDLPAVRHKNGPVDNGWAFFDPAKEFGRMGVSTQKNSQWILCKFASFSLNPFTDQQHEYSICPSYPKCFAVPESQILDLKTISEFRSKGRIPVLCWRNPENGVTLTRCAQPKTGFSSVYGNYRCPSDEALVRAIQSFTKSKQKLLIVDARPMTNAIANIAVGGGYENRNNYTECELEFLGIANLHVIRDSYTKLKETCEAYLCCDSEPKFGWYSALENSQWLNHMSVLLAGASKIAKSLSIVQQPVFVHCSDGWDRTPQLCGLAQIMVDAHYRTIPGFCTVIEKEFIQMGHKFADRCGFGSSENNMEERSPIFIQFLDSVWQVQRQYPAAFEFSEDFLIALADALFSGRYGTFLCNSQREREAERLSERADSLWSINFCAIPMFLNPFYDPKCSAILLPATDPKNLSVWNTYYLRYLSLNVERECVNHYLRLGQDLLEEKKKEKLRLESMECENKKLLKELEDLKEQVAHNKISAQPILSQTQEADVVITKRVVGWTFPPEVMESYIQETPQN
jgi:myotubularin-related protein 1/2